MMKFTYLDEVNGKQEINAKSFKIARTENGINIEMEFSGTDASGMLKLTLNQPDIREYPVVLADQ